MTQNSNLKFCRIQNENISQIKSSVQASGRTVSIDNAYIYDMMGNMTRKLAAGVLGRENAGGGREWYVKDYQGSLVMTIVNDAVGNVIAYEPYGSQKLLQANGDMPSEQYTGKEYVGRLGLYYFGARFFDPTLAMWLSPDPAGQYLNPYSYGGDPVNAVDLDGRWSWKSIGKGALAVAGLGVAVGVAPAVALGAGMTVDAMAGGTLSLGMLGLSATPAMFTGPASSYLSGGDRNDIGNSFVNGLFMDVFGGVAGASGAMTTLSYAQRCIYGEDCARVARDGIHGGFFVDNIGNMIGLGNVKFFGGTADWFELRDINSDWDGVSDYYQGNAVYSRGYLDMLGHYGVGGGDDHFGHAVMAVDRENKETIAHELNHVRQTENIGHRWLYLFNYLDNNGWSPFPNDAYYSNKMEMDSFYKAFLYKAGCIDIYGNEINTDNWTHEEMSGIFYNGGSFIDRKGITREQESYRTTHDVDYGPDWVWHENWWKDY